MTVIGMANVSNVNEIFENDDRYMYPIRVSANGIESALHLKRILRVRKISAILIFHILTNDRKRV